VEYALANEIEDFTLPVHVDPATSLKILLRAVEVCWERFCGVRLPISFLPFELSSQCSKHQPSILVQPCLQKGKDFK
jgi:hypothetical protein